MDDQLDNDLKKRIREVFDNYDDEHADAGWLRLREKYPEKAKRRAVAWLWYGSVAALVLIFLGIFLFRQAPVKKEKLVASKQHPVNPAPKNPGKENNIKDNGKADSVINSLQKQNFANNNIHPGHSHTNSFNKTSQLPVVPSVSNKQSGIIMVNKSKNDTASKELVAANQPKTQDQHITANNAGNNPKVDTAGKPPVKALAAVTAPGGVNMQEQVKKANKTLFADDEPSTTKKADKTNKAVRFGIYAATYFNYAKGSNSQLNVGAGVTSDIKLSRNLNLSTGVTIAQNTLSYGNQVPGTAQLDAGPAIAAAATTRFLAAGQNVYSAAVPSLKNYNASLVGLDIPLNLKYEFDPEKSTTYVSLGLSSGTFINETYTSTYNYTQPFVSSSLSQSADQSSHQSFNSFYFAKTLNFAFGTGYSIGRDKLIIEPFVKYPLDGLGSQQIKFGAGGINLKFNFQTQKK